ncbi:hypothetical protein MHTCC0001_21640 [Flavobacteriaceae bacterium MHTCC 0001]
MNSFETLLHKIDNAKALDFGDIINKTIELFKNAWVKGLVMVLLIVVIILPIFLSFYIPMFRSVMEQVESGGYDPNDTSGLMLMQSSSFQYKMLGITFVIGLLSTGLVAGFYRILKKVDHKESNTFSDYFYYFKTKYLGKIFAIASFSLLVGLLSLIIDMFLPAFAASLLKIGISIILSVYTTLFVVFFAFNPDLEASDIFVLSFKFGSKKWLLIFGLFFVTYILAFLIGFIACGIGVLFTISAVYMPIYLVYKDVFGFGAVSDIDLIGANDEAS